MAVEFEKVQDVSLRSRFSDSEKLRSVDTHKTHRQKHIDALESYYHAATTESSKFTDKDGKDHLKSDETAKLTFFRQEMIDCYDVDMFLLICEIFENEIKEQEAYRTIFLQELESWIRRSQAIREYVLSQIHVLELPPSTSRASLSGNSAIATGETADLVYPEVDTSHHSTSLLQNSASVAQASQSDGDDDIASIDSEAFHSVNLGNSAETSGSTRIRKSNDTRMAGEKALKNIFSEIKKREIKPEDTPKLHDILHVAEKKLNTAKTGMFMFVESNRDKVFAEKAISAIKTALGKKELNATNASDFFRKDVQISFGIYQFYRNPLGFRQPTITVSISDLLTFCQKNQNIKKILDKEISQVLTVSEQRSEHEAGLLNDILVTRVSDVTPPGSPTVMGRQSPPGMELSPSPRQQRPVIPASSQQDFSLPSALTDLLPESWVTSETVTTIESAIERGAIKAGEATQDGIIGLPDSYVDDDWSDNEDTEVVGENSGDSSDDRSFVIGNESQDDRVSLNSQFDSVSFAISDKAPVRRKSLTSDATSTSFAVIASSLPADHDERSLTSAPLMNQEGDQLIDREESDTESRKSLSTASSSILQDSPIAPKKNQGRVNEEVSPQKTCNAVI